MQSNRLALVPDEGARLRLLDALSAKGLAPLVRSARRRFFGSLLGGGADDAFAEKAAAELEGACAARAHVEGRGAYTPGELFCADDCVLTLVFGAGDEEGLSAGVVYSLDTAEPLARLERFCRDVREAWEEVGRKAGGPSAVAPPEWQARARGRPEGLARFIAIQPAEYVRAAAALRGGRELARASELMEEASVRAFLRRAQEMRREGYTPRRLLKEAGAGEVERMMEAGLLERELRVSCRKHGHALFDLPSPDSLAAVTLSRARCSLCAAPVADEVVEETINPTRLAVALLEDGGWLSQRVYRIVRALGVPDSEIATGPTSPHGESYLSAEVCGTSFLFVTKDGDLTPSFCRRVVETVEETEAAQLVVVVTGAAEDEGRLRLYEYAWRRARDGNDLGTTLVEGLDSARAQIERAFRAAVRRELARELFALDSALGFSAAQFVLEWFGATKAAGAEREQTHAPATRFAAPGRQAAS